jgi:hypothetical protein
MGERRGKKGDHGGHSHGHGDHGGFGNLTGGGPSIVGADGAMRARDVSRPRAEHDAAAERDLVIRRRPPDADAH